MTRSKTKALITCSLILGLVAVVQASARTQFLVDPDDADNRVQFVSDAPLEKITGVGKGLTGHVELDPHAVALTRGKLELEVASIRTNESLRDEHLKGTDWLDAAKYPKVTFEIKKVGGVDTLEPDKTVNVKVLGRLTMHGVSRDEVAKAKVRWTKGKAIRVTAQFSVNLTNYKVSVPSLVRLKVSDEITLNVVLSVKDPT